VAKKGIPFLRAFESRYIVSDESEPARKRFSSEGLFTAIASWKRKSPHQAAPCRYFSS